MSTNKKLGSAFEKRMCSILQNDGWWVHFIEPKMCGAQPFDIIAVKNGCAIAIDCKTCVSKRFSIDRMEDNQIYAFEKWLACGNGDPYVAVEHDGDVYIIKYTELKERGSLALKDLKSARWGETDGNFSGK